GWAAFGNGMEFPPALGVPLVLRYHSPGHFLRRDEHHVRRLSRHSYDTGAYWRPASRVQVVRGTARIHISSPGRWFGALYRIELFHPHGQPLGSEHAHALRNELVRRSAMGVRPQSVGGSSLPGASWGWSRQQLVHECDY